MFIRIVLTCAFAAVACASSARAGRIYGTGNISWLHNESDGNRLILVQQPGSEEIDELIVPVGTSEDLNSETLLLNYEDILFYKNRLRLSAYLYRRELGQSDDREFRPIYSAELRSFGYFFSSSYSPYTEQALAQTASGLRTVEIKHREWRNTLSVTYPNYPTLSVILNKNTTKDTETGRRVNGEIRNFLVDAGYTLGPASARLNYSNLRRKSEQTTQLTTTQNNYTGALGFNHQISALGFVSGNYTYYDSRNTISNLGDSTQTKSNNHAVALMLGTQQWHQLSATASYSGRFAETRSAVNMVESDNQSFAGQVNYRPLSYLSFDATKSYQINTDQTAMDINENLSVAATVTRSIRRGVDTRLTASRIFVQQSPLTTSSSDGRYTLDTYYGSFSVEPHGFIRTIFDASLLHNSEPYLPQQRYQMNMSLNSRFYFSRTLEGRFNFTALYQGERFELGRSYSQNLNVGGSYSPQSNMTLSASYLYTIYNAANQISTGTWIGYGSYSFRRIYTLSVSANYQNQETPVLALPGQTDLIRYSPYTITGQVQVNLAPRTTLTTAYTYSETPTFRGQKTIDRMANVILNVQL